MSHMNDTGDPNENQADDIAFLLRLAGRRPMPDPARARIAREAAHAEWTRAVGRRGRLSRWALTAGLVATAILVAMTWLRDEPAPVPRAEIATLQTVRGIVVLTRAGMQPAPVTSPGTTLRTGDRIETRNGSRTALILSDGISVRLDVDTVAVLQAADHVTLNRGAVYVDSGATPRHSGVRVETPLGVVRHLGTQFEVRWQNSAVEIRVREGSIVVEDRQRSWASHAGEALRLVAGRSPDRRSIPTSGPSWDWITDLAPPFVLEGATVRAFLEWVTREQGWQWRYDDPVLRQRVDRIVLHGSIDGLTAEEALWAVLPTCGLSAKLTKGVLVVGLAGGG